MPFVILPTNSASGGYDVTNSLRFNSGSSDKLSRSASSGSNTKYTVSCWVKRSGFDSSTTIFSTGDTSPDNNARMLFINADNRVQVAYYNAGYTYQVETSALLRDASAWYHLVSAVDTTQATASDRIKIYINGTLQTSFSTASYPSQNSTFNFNSATQYIGDLGGRSIFSNFYLSDFYYVDGTQVNATSFGETDEDTGIWKPKAYTGTYGTNGFYLQFKNSASLGTDSSGNGNTFTVNNLTSIDQTTDTPTNNFATMNPLLNRYSGGTGYLISFSEGNLKTTADNTSAYTNTGGTFQLTQGKWYWEAKNGGTGYTAFPTACSIGIHDLAAGFAGTAGTETLVRGYNADGTKNSNDSTSSYGNSFVSGDIIMVALDLDNGKIWFGKNGTWQNSGSPTGGTNAAFTDLLSVSATGWSPWTQGYRGSSGVNVVFDWNFGNPPYSGGSFTDSAGFGNFSYQPPAGFYSLNTKNLSLYG